MLKENHDAKKLANAVKELFCNLKRSAALVKAGWEHATNPSREAKEAEGLRAIRWMEDTELLAARPALPPP